MSVLNIMQNLLIVMRHCDLFRLVQAQLGSTKTKLQLAQHFAFYYLSNKTGIDQTDWFSKVDVLIFGARIINIWCKSY